jgi:hypothetical protein
VAVAFFEDDEDGYGGGGAVNDGEGSSESESEDEDEAGPETALEVAWLTDAQGWPILINFIFCI